MRWFAGFVVTFIVGVHLLASVPAVNPDGHLVAGWGLLIVSFVCIAKAYPDDEGAAE